MNFGVVFLKNRGSYAIEILSNPINLETSSDSVHATLLTFEYFRGTSDPSLRQKCDKSAAGSCVWVCQPLPIGEPARAGDPEGIKCGTADSDRVGSLVRIESER